MATRAYHYSIPMQGAAQEESHSNVVMMDIPLDLKMFMDARNVNVSSSNSSEVSKLHPGQILTTAQLQAAAVAAIDDPGSSSSEDHSHCSPSDEDLASSSTSVHISDLPPSSQHHHLAPSAIISTVPDIHDSSSPSPLSDEGQDPDTLHQSHTLTDLSSSAPPHSSLLHVSALSHHQHLSHDSSPDDHSRHHHQSHMQEQHVSVAAASGTVLSMQQQTTSEAASSNQQQGLYQPVYSDSDGSMVASNAREVYQQPRGQSSTSVYSSSSSAMPLTVMHTISSATNNSNNLISTVAPSYLSSTLSKVDNSNQDIVYTSMTTASIDSHNDTIMTSGGSYQIITATSLPYTMQDVNGRTVQSFAGSVGTSHGANVIHNPNGLSIQSHDPGLVSNVGTGGNIIASPTVGSSNTFSNNNDSGNHHDSVVSSTTATGHNNQHHPPVTLGTNSKTGLSAGAVAALDIPSSQLYRCFDCNSAFRSKRTFDNHMMKFHGVNTASATSANGGISAASMSAVASNISSQNITSNREGESQIMVMLHSPPYTSSSSYSSSTNHASSHQQPIIAQPLHHPHRTVSNGHPSQLQSGMLQQIILEPVPDRDGTSNTNIRMRSYHDSDGNQNQTPPPAQQVYTLQSTDGQYASEQMRDNTSNDVIANCVGPNDGRGNNVIITVPRSSVSYGTDTTNSSTRTVIASNNVEYQILTQQEHQQQHFKNRGAPSSGLTVSSVSDSSTAVYQQNKTVTTASCDSNRFNSHDTIVSSGGETYVVASSDLHQLQQSGGQLFLPASNQQQQELPSRLVTQEQMQTIENANTPHQSQQILVPVSRINSQQHIHQQETITSHVQQEHNLIQEHLQENSNIEHQINTVQHQVQQQQQQHIQDDRAQPVSSQSSGTVFYDQRVKKLSKEELIVPNAVHVYCEGASIKERNAFTHYKATLSPEKGRGNRPFKCNKCTASFIDASECEEHKRKHSGDGPFTCEDCHFSFMYKSHFKSHKTRCLKKRANMTVAQLHAAAAPVNTGLPKAVIVPSSGIKREFPTHQTVQVTGGTANTAVRGGHGKKRRMSSAEIAKVTASRLVSTNSQSNEVYYTTVDEPPQYSTHQQYSGGSGGSLNQQGAGDDGNEGLTSFNTKCGVVNASRVEVSGGQYHSSPNNRVTVNKGEVVGLVSQHKRIINPVNVKPEAELNSFNPVNPSFKRLKRQNNEMRPHECDECDASFTTEEDLMHHKQKHSGDGPFRCDSCQFVYLYRRLYDAHKRKCKKGKSKRDGPVSSVGEHSHNSNVAGPTVVVPASLGSTGTSSSGGDGGEAGQHQQQEQQQQQHHVQFVQQHIQQQMQHLQQQQQPGVASNNSNIVQQQQPQIIFIDQQQQSKLGQQQQIDLSGLTQHGGVITLPASQQHNNGTNHGHQQFQIVGPGGIQVLDTSNILELRGQQLVAVGGAGLGSGDVKYEIVQALDMDNVAQLMNLIKKGAVVTSAQ